MNEVLKKIAEEEKRRYKDLTIRQRQWLKIIVEDAHKAENRPIPKWWWALAVGHLCLENENAPYLYDTPKICLPGECYERVGNRIIFRFMNNRQKYALEKNNISLGLEIGHIVIYGHEDINLFGINLP